MERTKEELNLYNYLTEEIDKENQQSEKQKECVMNYSRILNENETFYSYSCSKCNDSESGSNCGNQICYLCYKNCHKNHNIHIKKPIETNSKITVFKCSCAENFHHVQKITMNVRLSTFGSHCMLGEVFFNLNARFVFQDVANIRKSQKKYYCLFCVLSCRKIDQSSLKKIPLKKFSDHYLCACDSSHKSFLNEFGNLEKFLNYYQLQGLLLTNHALKEYYIDPIISVHKVIYGYYKNKNYQELNQRHFSIEQYVIAFELLYKTAKYVEFNCLISESNFNRSFNMDFLDMIFTLEDIDDVSLINTKTKCLFYFRAFHVFPITKIKTTSRLNAHWKNVNPIHRLIMKRDINDFFDAIKINKYSFFSFFIRVSSTVLRYHSKTDDLSYANFVIEYLKWCSLLLSMRFKDENDYNFVYRDILSEYLIPLFSIIQSNKLFANRCRKYVSVFARTLILCVNDEVFYRRVFMEGPLKERQETFAFQKGSDNCFTMMKILPFKQEELNEIFEDKNNWELYDILFNPDDFYLENLHSLINSKQTMTYEIKAFFMSIININPKNYFDHFEQLNPIYKSFDLIDQLKINYVNAKITETDFSNNILKALESIKDHLLEVFPEVWGKQIDKQRLRYSQIFLFKNNFLDCLIHICFIYTRNNYLKHYIGLTQYERILSALFDNILIMINNNPFLICTFFTTDSINSIIDKPEISSKIRSIRVGFYNKMLKMLKKDNYRLNYGDFIIQLTNYFEIFKTLLQTRPTEFNQVYLNELNILLQCFSKSLQTSTEKSKYKVSSIISIMIKAIIHSKYLEQLLENITIKGFKSIGSPERNFILNCIKVITNLEDYIFYSLNILKLMGKILELFKTNELAANVSERKYISSLYSKYYLTDSFYILKNVKPKHLTNMKIIFDQNLRGRLNFGTETEENDTLEEMTKQGSKTIIRKKGTSESTKLRSIDRVSKSPLKKNSTLNILYKKRSNENDQIFRETTKPSPIRHDIKWDRKTTTKCDFNSSSKLANEGFTFKEICTGAAKKNPGILSLLFTPKDLSNAVIWLSPLFQNMERFKRYYLKLKSEYYLTKPKRLLNYFFDSVMYPTIFALFKIIYFSTDINIKLKYLAYKLISLYIQCYHFLLTEIKTNITLFKDNDEVIEKLLLFLHCDKESIDNTLYNLVNDSKSEIDKVKSNEYEPCRFKVLLQMFFKYIPPNCLYRLQKDNEGKIKSGTLSQEERTLSTNQPPQSQIQSNPQKKVAPFQLPLTSQLLSSDTGYTELSVMNYYGNDQLSCSHTLNYNQDEAHMKTQLTAFIDFYNKKKSDLSINSLFCLFKKESTDEDNTLLELKKDIILDMLLFYNENAKIGSIWKEDAYILLDIINKLFKADPDLFHEVILNNLFFFAKDLIYSMIKTQLLFLFQIVIIDFQKMHKPDTQTIGCPKKNLLSVIEFLRLLCENHTKIFQILLTRVYITQDELALLDFVLKMPVIILKNISKYKKKKEYLTAFKEYDNEYFHDVFDAVSNFLIEIIQGSLESNMAYFKNNEEFDNYYETGYLTLGFLGLEENDYFLCTFFRFLNCFLEENLNLIESKKEIIKRFSAHKLLDGLVISTKKLCDLYQLNTESPKLNKLLLELFIKEDCLSENCQFLISSEIFKIFKTAVQWKEGSRFQQIFNDLENEKDQTIKHIFMFYDTIIKEVEVSYRFKDNIEQSNLNYHKELFSKEIVKDDKMFYANLETEYKKEHKGIQKVVYLVHRDSLFIKGKDLDRFIEEAPSDKPHIKLHYILNFISYLQDEISFRKILFFSNQKIKRHLYTINYQYMNYISIALAVILNLLLLLFTYHSTSAIEERHFSLIFIVNCTQTVFNLSIVVIWSYFTMLRFKLITKLDCYDILINTLTEMNDGKIKCIVWNLTIGVIAILSENLYFLFSLELFSLVSIFETMQIAMNSVQMRSKQFFSATFMILVLVFVFGYIKFYWFSSSSNAEDDNFLSCMLSITTGIMNQKGMDFPTKKMETKGYFAEFIIGWLFYFSIILLMINVINGIIVDTFQALREQNNIKSDIRDNVCYVCSLKRATFEKNGISFEHHRSYEHSIMYYFHYILKILLTDEQELNSLDYSVLNSVRNNKTDFFPVKHSLSIAQKKINDDEE